jgi:hypothetical protein
MREPYGGSLASNTGPESCAANRKVGREALTRVHAGGVFSREIAIIRSADAVQGGGRQYWWVRNGERPLDSARSKTPHAWKLHAREPGGPANARREDASGPVGEGDEPQSQHERW